MASSSNFEFQDTYDIFLSFRGLDTRKKFTDHLYEALKREKFQTFRDDDEIERGEIIKSELKKAIENSRMSIIVLSKNYANSTACLFEIQTILEQWKTSDHMILPVFYEVDPLDIKEQSKNLDFGKKKVTTVEEVRGQRAGLKEVASMAGMGLDFGGKKVTVEEVRGWRAALKEVASMAGMVSGNLTDGYEAKFIEEIVVVIKRKLTGDQGSNQLLIPPTKDFVESTQARNTENVWECLMNDNVRRIGVYGMGGVGKTTIMKNIHNQLLEKKGKFGNVYWVTVSKAFNITKIQSDIAKAQKLRFSDDEDETIRASELYAALSRKKKYVLILDDLWESFALERVGIPEPTRSNECKIVFTTRSLDVCRMMDCTAVKVELLTHEEALTLFLTKAVRNDVVLAPEVKEIAAKIAKKCARLPLAVVTVAGSLRGLEGIPEWRNALNELIRSTKDASDGKTKVFEILKFSYDRLGNKVLQDCFLYCSLYPEDRFIPVNALIEYWIAEELIADMNSVEAQFDKGHAILGKLTSSCLLECVADMPGMMKHIKLHDLIRDMAITITASSPRFMVKAGEIIKSVPYEHWSEDLERISFMFSLISELPITPPICPRLTTLLLNGAISNQLEVIPDSFFTNMPCLEVLDLSRSIITSLPESISNLENLHALILDSCTLLEYVPSLEKLKALKIFVLTISVIEELPEGIEELVNLRKLDLSNNLYIRRTFPSWKLRKLSKLQYLRIDGTVGTGMEVSAEDLMCLSQLKVVAVNFHNVQELNRYAISQQFQGLQKYRLIVGKNHLLVRDLGKEFRISFESIPFGIGADQPVLPADIEAFVLYGFHDPISLSAIPWLKDAKNLRRCEVSWCKGLESIFSSSTFSEDGQISLGTVKSFDLSYLPKFRVLFDGIAQLHNIYFNLKELSFSECDAVKNIFPVQLLENFPNLESLRVERCENVEDIIVEIAEISDRGNHQDYSNSISLPKLKNLTLHDLPRLKSIYDGVMVCQSIEQVMVYGCPMVRRLPLSLHMDGEQATAPPAIRIMIIAKKEWWVSLEWDDPLTRTFLRPYAQYVNLSSCRV